MINGKWVSFQLQGWVNLAPQVTLLVFDVYVACLYISTGKDDYDKFMESYRSPHQQRVEFLQNKCERIDIGYEILNNNKSTYKCPNGKEYKK